VDKFINLVLSVAPCTSVMVRVSLLSKSLPGGVELEWPQEVVSFLEVGTKGSDFVDEVFSGSNSVLAELSLNNAVIGEWDSALVNFPISSLVDEVSDCLLTGVAVSNVGFDSSDHVDGSLVKSNKCSVVELSQS
jgi:hypothetical protein